MPEHQQTQQSKTLKPSSQRRTTLASQNHVLNPAAIIQHARVDPKSLTSADVLQLQRTLGNRTVSRLLSGSQHSSVAQQATIQRQEIPEEEEPLQGKMIETIQRQEIPEEEEPLQGMFEKKPEESCPSCVQRQKLEEEKPLQGKMIETVQRQEKPEEEEPLQGIFENKPEQSIRTLYSTASIQRKKENRTGMPDILKAGVENLSGIDMNDVRLCYNSSKPREVGALAYTQGTNIHIAPGQERHLPHEAWHVVQQKQGRVQPTLQAKGVEINDDAGLENEADVMGSKALSSMSVNMNTRHDFSTIPTNDNLNRSALQMKPVIQMLIRDNGEVGDIVVDKKNKDLLKHKVLYEIIKVINNEKKKSYKLRLISEHARQGTPNEMEVETGQHHYTIKKMLSKEEIDYVNMKSKADIRDANSPRPTMILELPGSRHEYWEGEYHGDRQEGDQIVFHKKGSPDIWTIAGPLGRKGIIKGSSDSGSNSIENNVRKGEEIITNFIDKQEAGQEILIFMKSHSRNAVACTRIVNRINELYKDSNYFYERNKSFNLANNLKKVTVEAVFFDPVPGPKHGIGHTVAEDVENDVPNVVGESTLVYSINLKKLYQKGNGFEPQKVLGAKRLIISRRGHGVVLKSGVKLKIGDKIEEKTYRGLSLNSLPEGAYLSEGEGNLEEPEVIKRVELAAVLKALQPFDHWYHSQKGRREIIKAVSEKFFEL